ncbi:S8 family peptidase [Actinokineospora alba]|nr:S8 family serine peptidase [Actinokineospora alba]
MHTSAREVAMRLVTKFAAMAAVVAAALVGVSVPAGAAEPAADGEYLGAVTLITGDRVTVRRVGARLVPAVDPAEGREHVHFATTGDGIRLHVIPSDAWTDVNAGRLDLRLFDVALLIRDGYDDKNAAALPLIADDLTSLSAAKDGDFWVQRKQSRDPGKLWLDGMRKPSLDTSVPQVGAPQAWQGGFTGKGVTVAVLDTGVDATHADLRDRVIEAKNFTDGTLRDEDGHGTHVASTIAGTGRGDRKYTGVAPDAKLLVGKVCGPRGCPESAILAGMRWAAESGAKVVNLSLGGPDARGDDPLEVGVNQLSARHGTLFVVASGNDGSYGAETVSSPASADAALAVGAVDGDDALASFSGRGPRIHDAALKPEIVAPGVNIMAARSRHSFGKPQEKYRELSGTSMATPHVAGAAAILAQRHPEWTGTQLKAALMASAMPIEAGNYDQGAGRVDIAHAVKQTLYAEPAAVSMGRQAWPHHDDAPVTKPIAYTNAGDQPVTVRLTLTTAGPGGEPAPDMFRLSATELTIPARGQATVQLTADTKGDAAEGAFSARVTAESATGRVTTPVAIDREPESYDLTIKTLDTTGALSDNNFSFLFGIDPSRYRGVPTIDGVGTVRVRKGSYHLDSVINTPRPDGVTVNSNKVVHPTIDVTADTTVVLDARSAKPIAVTFDRADVRPKAVGAGYGRVSGERAVFTGVLGDTFERIFIGQVGEPLPEAEFVADIGGAWAVPDRFGEVTRAAVAYHLAWFDYGRLPTGFAKHVVDSDLAEVRTTYREQAARRGGTKIWVAKEPVHGTAVGYGIPFELPRTRTEFHNVDGLSWSAEFQQWRKVRKSLHTETVVTGGAVAHEAGKSYVDDWNTAVFGPSFRVDQASRSRDTMSLSIPMYADAGLDRVGVSEMDSGSTVLFMDGVKVGETDTAGQGSFDVRPEQAAYRLETTATRSGVSGYSTSVSTVWTFTSVRPPDDAPGKGKGGVPLPLMVVRAAPQGLDDGNRTTADSAKVPVAVQWNKGLDPVPLTSLTVEASFDDGRTWRAVPVAGGVATVDHPRSARFVSLRAKAADANGNTVEQTTIRAYGI